MPSTQQILIIVISVIVFLLAIPILLTRKGVVSGFKLIDENRKRVLVSKRNKIILFYAFSALFLVGIKSLDIAIRTIDMDVTLYNTLTISFFISALICYVLSFVFLYIWCRLNCRKKWLWLVSFLLGAATIIPNLYLLFEVIKNSKADTSGRRS